MAPTTAAVDGWIAKVRRCEHLTESELKALCDLVREILMEESNVQPVSSPVIVCGDVHGQFFDVLELFRVGGEIPAKSYVFMGDFVDRGRHSVETLQLLLCYKARYPACITLLRGNHECRQVTQVYGFYDECFRKYGSANAWKYCTEVFDYFALAAVIDSKVLCVHGGLSPRISTLDQIRLLERNQEIPHEGAYCDLMWSDPEEIEDWAVSQRGAGWLFGSKVTANFNHTNGLELIARAHQLVQEGYKYMFPEKNLITVWSAPNCQQQQRTQHRAFTLRLLWSLPLTRLLSVCRLSFSLHRLLSLWQHRQHHAVRWVHGQGDPHLQGRARE
jgi:serine/threonine-protein phosphatase 6 catalytic subunit